ncbi:MAG: hypothetical protein IPM43_01750 [Actinomycetota bacterium]|nr:MAG: hypothetical protein IPM43_01750 [Actinomycetota bacterium]
MLADLLPAKVRYYVYLTLTTLLGLELVFDVLDSGVQQKIIEAMAVLGFILAAGNTNRSN